MLRVPRLPADPAAPFPDPRAALREPDGLLAHGGDLTPTRLLNAYAHGIFPWSSDGQPLLWWSPDPRTVFRTDGVHLSRRFLRTLPRLEWTLRADTAFDAVVQRCATAPRDGQDGTWITTGMRDAYGALHRLGHAHSIEAWDGDALVGGLYGVAIGRMFFAESMFSDAAGGSKVALAGLASVLHAWGWPLIDAQVASPHLERMGAQAMPREAFLRAAARLVAVAEPARPWTHPFGELNAKSLGDAGR